MYRLLRPLLFSLPPERAHSLALRGLELPGVRSVMGARLEDPRLQVECLGRTFAHPIGLAAGFDKDARHITALDALGFSFIEVGTLTAHPQPGNPKPRLFRLPADRALINRMGFNNEGSLAAAARLAGQPFRRGVLGINIGKSKITPLEEATEDYLISVERLLPYADYIVVNVSSPNTPGLRDLQAVEKLEPLLRAVQARTQRTPLLLKVAPDLADEDVDAIAELALRLGLWGLIATNTTVSREGLRTPASVVEAIGAGGLSGPPVRERALHVLKRLRARVGSQLTLVAAGGIETPEHVWERLLAGASLVQIYTGFIYGGPRTPVNLARGLIPLLEASPYANVQEAIGAGA